VGFPSVEEGGTNFEWTVNADPEGRPIAQLADKPMTRMSDTRNFDEKLGDLIGDHLETLGPKSAKELRDEIISAIELQLMALREEADDEDN